MYSQDIFVSRSNAKVKANLRWSLLLAVSAFLLIAVLLPLTSSAVATKIASRSRLSILDGVIRQAIDAGEIPGAVVVIGHNGQIAYRKAYGYRALEPRRERMTLDTIFDLASLRDIQKSW